MILLIIRVKRFEKEPVNLKNQVRYYESDENGNIYKNIEGEEISIPLDALAAGYRGIFIMIGDMMNRLTNNFKKDVKDIAGIVLIDEFDAHLHPKYQYELPKLLSDAFPKVQFIVSTHSPIPLLSFSKENEPIVYKVERTAEGITTKRLDNEMDIWRLNPNALLTSPIFGVSSLYSRGVSSVDANPFSSYQTIQAERELDLSLEMKQNFDDLNLELE
jgi:predicted ATP-dependent endonuclease of OLD family